MSSLHKIIKPYHPDNENQVEQYRLQDNFEEFKKYAEARRREDPNHPATIFRNREEELMEDALKRSEQILDVARQEGEKIRKEAYDKGYADGLENGKDDGYWQAYNEHMQIFQQDRDKIMEEVEESIASIKREKEALLDKYLEDLKNISVTIAEKVIQISLKTSGDIIKRMIVAATEKLKKTEWVKIYVSKYDVDLMVEGDVQLLNSLSYLSDNIKIIMMDKEESGTCIIELPKEIIDISVNTQLENIKEILNNAQM